MSKNKDYNYIPKGVKAFTLAEVLIVIGIIGMIAEMTIPTLVNSVQDKATVTGFKKAYSVANQAYTMANIDNGGGFGAYSAGTNQSYVKFNALKSKLNVIRECPYDSNAKGKCWASSGVGLKNWNVDNCGCASNTSVQDSNTSFTTADGMFWMLYTYDSSNAADIIFVDVNGDKKPNDWGKDAFMFVMNDTNITPFTYDCAGFLKHNDGTTADPNTEFTAPLMK